MTCQCGTCRDYLRALRRSGTRLERARHAVTRWAGSVQALTVARAKRDAVRGLYREHLRREHGVTRSGSTAT